MHNRAQRLLVIRGGPIGDFVLSLAAMERIRAAHPKAAITLLTTARFGALALASPYFNAVETDGDPASPMAAFALARRIKRARYDRVYDLQCDSASAMLFRMMWPRRPAWSGVARGASLPHRNARRSRMHLLERHADQLRAAGIWPDAPVQAGSAPPPDLSWILRKSRPRSAAGALPHKPFVILAPGGSSRAEKRWPVENFASLAATFHRRGFDIVVVGGLEESALARTIQRTVDQARDLTGRTDFAQIAALGARAALAVGNASGAIQVVAAAGAPTIALFSGASDPGLNGPRGYVTILQAADLKDLPVAHVTQAAALLAPPRTAS